MFNNCINVYIFRCEKCNDAIHIYNEKDYQELLENPLCYSCKKEVN